MFIFIRLWSTVYETNGYSSIEGLSLKNTIWYFFIAEVLVMGKSRPDVAISQEVKDGMIAYTLTKPYNYLIYHFFKGLGESCAQMLLIFTIGLPLVVYFASLPQIMFPQLLLAGITFLFALILDYFMLSSIGLFALAIEETDSLHLIYQKIVFILGGLLLPIDFLPSWLQKIALFLPFGLTVYAPAKLSVDFKWSLFSKTLQLQIFWILLLSFVLIIQYSWARKRLAINGG